MTIKQQADKVSDLSGIVVIDKEPGMTSHDVVVALRKLVKLRRIGHTGTLDPEATGVLPVCIGKATKVVDLLVDQPKVYQAVLKLGVTTTTQDQTGQVCERQAVKVDKSMVISTILSFVGQIEQVPPMYSALKQGGKRLYELARQGITVERPARPVTIYSINQIEQLTEDSYSFEVTCSKGTYIRTLCHDIGQKLGCGGHMSKLKRLAVGPFKLAQAKRLDICQQAWQEKRFDKLLWPVDTLFADYPAVMANESINRLLYNGNPINLNQCHLMASERSKLVSKMEMPMSEEVDWQLEDKRRNEEKSKRYRLYDYQGKFIGIYDLSASGRLKVVKFFLSND